MTIPDEVDIIVVGGGSCGQVDTPKPARRILTIE